MTFLVIKIEFTPKCIPLPARSLRSLDSHGNIEFACTDEAPVKKKKKKKKMEVGENVATM